MPDSVIKNLNRQFPMREIEKLLKVMERLRDPESGCPWDLAQTYASIAPHTIEEAYEVADAILQENWEELQKELGDLLFQVVFYAQLAKEEGRFAFADVVASVTAKMIRRHPHVFGTTRYADQAEQEADWERIKAAERPDGATGVLDGVPLGLPATTRAVKLQRKAARVGFDWPTGNPMPVLDKVAEEVVEIRAALQTGADSKHLTEELGDLLFACINLARHLGADSEFTLHAANRKFERRFRRMEEWLKASGRSFAQASLQELDALWERAKVEE